MKTKKVSRTCKQCGKKYKSVASKNKHFCSRKCFSKNRIEVAKVKYTRDCDHCGKTYTNKHSLVTQFCSHSCFLQSNKAKKKNGLCQKRGCNHMAVDVTSAKRFCRKHRDERNEVKNDKDNFNDQLAKDLVEGLVPKYLFVNFREQSGRYIVLDTLDKAGLFGLNEPLTRITITESGTSVERRGDLLIPDLKLYIEAKRGLKTSCLSKTIRQFETDLNLLKEGYDKSVTGFYYSIIGDIGHSLSEALMILQIKIKDAVKNGSLKHKPWVTDQLVDGAFNPIIRELLSREQALGIN